MIASFRRSGRASGSRARCAPTSTSPPPSLVGNRPDATLDPALVARPRRHARRGGASTSRGALASGPSGPSRWSRSTSSPRAGPGWRFREGGPDGVWPSPAARRRGRVGAVRLSPRRRARAASVRLRTDRGERDFPVAGVFYDYGSSAGVVVMGRRTYERFWDDRLVSAWRSISPPARTSPSADGRACASAPAGRRTWSSAPTARCATPRS